MTNATITDEIRMELLTDIGTAMKNVAKDFLPTARIEVFVQRNPDVAVLRVPGATNKGVEAALYELAGVVKAQTDEALPSLDLEYKVIGGSDAAGIEVTAKPTGQPVYGNIIKATLAWLRPSAELRRQRPNLPERIVL